MKQYRCTITGIQQVRDALKNAYSPFVFDSKYVADAVCVHLTMCDLRKLIRNNGMDKGWTSIDIVGFHNETEIHEFEQYLQEYSTIVKYTIPHPLQVTVQPTHV